ncbi:hypothetical protein COO91_03470 [Nostoc flagelliforme CCNUN1]|uniref:Uncharacterized protein n=1 Tax=Nostoc flagelliforme CCNUN1 TaxID=2038116 RepID=A0A2K8SRT4_9NOSO|nr:hypothetical protein [Nostoc flagelliforme]AUB37525.1 hypothetical protein COO91_03470 [Nostoc flagelliforme CCNUN1]
MAVTNFKPTLDIPDWRPLAVSPTTGNSGAGLIFDLRNNGDKHPEIFQLAANTVLNAYHVKNDGWSFVGSPALVGTFSAGAAGVFAPSHGPRGAIAAGATTTKITASSTIGIVVGVNQLAGRDDARGYKIRIIDNGAGGSGKTEERLIVANTSSTTPTIILSTALSFTPVAGSTFEILSGRCYLLSAGTTANGMWKYFDPALCLFSGNLSVTNLPSSVSTDSCFVALDELYVPYTNSPGEGFLVGAGTYNGGGTGCLIATATSSTTITGQASAGDASVVANEYRNFQIRIVEDTGNPTATGQRRRIASHTAGPSPVYTITAWTITPSATCKFVIENNNDILLWASAALQTYSYAAFNSVGGQSADSWSSSAYASRGSSTGPGCMAFQPFGMLLDAEKNSRYSHIHAFRGNSTNSLDILDIAGAATGVWSNGVAMGSNAQTFSGGSCLAYDPVGIAPTPSEQVDGRGQWAYINVNAGQSFFRYNAYARKMSQWAQLRYTQGAAVVGQRIATSPIVDASDSTKIGGIFLVRSSGPEMFMCLAQR